jgi:hypothetical protein
MNTEIKDEDVLLPFERQILRGDYKEYYKIKRNNFHTAIGEFPLLWESFQLLDEIWLREFDDLERLREPDEALPLLLFMYAHGQARIARELGFSCCIGEAWNAIRTGIESVAHAYKLHRNPQLGPVWSHKDDGKSQWKAFRDAFLDDKAEKLFPAELGLEDLHKFYSDFSEWGTHSTVWALGLRVKGSYTSPTFNMTLHSFESEPKKIGMYVSLILNVSGHMERAFFNCFSSRLELDPELLRRRKEYRIMADRANGDLLQRFDIPSS